MAASNAAARLLLGLTILFGTFLELLAGLLADLPPLRLLLGIEQLLHVRVERIALPFCVAQHRALLLAAGRLLELHACLLQLREATFEQRNDPGILFRRQVETAS